eukprot:CAMPEP_0197542496 /NCGR_PEP_ID=MMETSP1318-20131121/67737_1 /TAXON_ID=552666 /ORGANISM="Partenskyella glossopodia, Strain RCC365" /LENGTH=92 /DNA_ID=CAMNT_0043101767 /DNA_START=1005 /DNA_END=1280 /DNA_ORIENTATION=-
MSRAHQLLRNPGLHSDSTPMDIQHTANDRTIALALSNQPCVVRAGKADFISKSSSGLRDAVAGQLHEAVSKAVDHADADLEDPEKDLSASVV